MFNVWSYLSKMKKEFPLGCKVEVDEETIMNFYWDYGTTSRVAKVIDYVLEEGMLVVVNAAGLEFSVYPDEVEPYFEPQVC
jgi:hypothetical protein